MMVQPGARSPEPGNPEQRPEFSPVPPDAPKEDRIGTAFLAMGAAAAGAVTWFALLTLIQSHLIEGSTIRSIAQVNPDSADVNFVVYGTVLGLGLTALTAWLLLRAIPSSYRRGALAMVSALAGAPVGRRVRTAVARAKSSNGPRSASIRRR